MSNLHQSIQELLEQDYNPVTIAYMLDVPISWVYEVTESLVTESSWWMLQLHE